MKQSSAKKILFLIQLPPPVHGVSIINEILINNPELSKTYKIKTIDLATAKSISGIGKINLNKILRSLSILLQSTKEFIVYRPKLVYITFSPSGPAFMRDALLCLVAKLFRIRLLIHLHGKGLISLPKGSLRSRLASIVFHNEFVICLSEGLKGDIKHLSPLRVFTLANGITSNKTGHDSNKDVSTTKLLYLSNLIRTKGIIDLIDALAIVVKAHQNWQLSIIGNEGDITFTELGEYIKIQGLDNYISILGPKYNEDKHKELGLADAFVFPTYYPNECFPLVLLEAMQQKLCVISTHEGAIPEIITHNKTGLLFTQRNIPELANCLNKVISDREKMLELANNGNLEFNKKYTSTKMNDAFMQILTQTLS